MIPALVLFTTIVVSQRFEAVEPHMGTLVHIVIYAGSKDQAKRAFTQAFTRITELDNTLSDYNPDSELNRLCSAGTLAHASPDLFRVLTVAQQIAAESDGAFDITAAPVIRLWREARKTKQLPTNESLAEAQRRSGWRKLTLDEKTNSPTLAGPGMLLDVGGLAKGYVAEEAAKTLRSAGISEGLVAASGDIVAFGNRHWPVTLELLNGTREILLHNAAVSTAGDTEQYVEIDHVRYSHIINPATGLAINTRIAAAVVAPTGIEADALDTTLVVLGPTKGIELLKKHHPHVSALIVTDAGAVEFNKLPYKN